MSPELLAILHQMGHGDEIILADANFPGYTFNDNVIRADGHSVSTLLDGVLPLIELDTYAEPLIMMEVVEGDTLDPAVEEDYMKVINQHSTGFSVTRIDRFAFYDRARSAFAVVMTGEGRKYGNIVLKKGVILPS